MSTVCVVAAVASKLAYSSLMCCDMNMLNLFKHKVADLPVPDYWMGWSIVQPDYRHCTRYSFHKFLCFQPSNIFVSSDLQQVQVGDFGLACSLLTHNPEVAILPSMHAHRGQVGTKLYAAPEQLNSVCTAKVSVNIFVLHIMRKQQFQNYQFKLFQF